jgi:hypothetical protein
MSLTFKKGSLTNFNAANFNKDDFCFVTNSTGTMGTIRIIKDASKNYYGLMPDFGTDNDTGKALISKGSTSSPTYDTLGISGGGTGAVSLTKNRLLCVNDSSVFSITDHYIDKS